MIFGANFLDKFGFAINYNEYIIRWVDHSIPLKDPHEIFGPKMLKNLNDQLCQEKEDNMFDCKILDNYAAQILHTEYEQININKVAVDQKHLTQYQHHDLQNILTK